MICALEHARWIRGNWERWQTDPSAAPESEIVQGAAAHVIAALGPERVAELGRLPAEDSYDHTLFCHSSPGSDMEPISRDADPDSDDQALAGVTQPRVVFGHTHVQFRRVSAAGIELVNPGSVGLPWDGDQRAAYALIDDERVELSEPSKVNVFTSPIWLKNGTIVIRTKRRSFDTTACTLSDVPSLSTTMTGC